MSKMKNRFLSRPRAPGNLRSEGFAPAAGDRRRAPLGHRPPRRRLTVYTRLMAPFRRFFALEASSGILLLGMAVLALVWANSPYAEAYFRLWATPVTVGAEGFGISKPLLLWINDGLMAIFFFVVGLEIKREVLMGELSERRKALLPISAAVGGMVIPALLYVAFNAGTPGSAGWGIPMATDIAFALGVVALLGSRVPLALKVFVTAVAVVDDLGAVVVIALFYTADLSLGALGIAAVALAGLVAINRMGVRRIAAYGLLGAVLWVAFLKSGVHATIAGVLLAMTIPAIRRTEPTALQEQARALLKLSWTGPDEGTDAGSARIPREELHALERAIRDADVPLVRLEHALHPWVAFGVMPVFALANAGVALGGQDFSSLSSVTLGIVMGLLVGKQVGVFLFSWLALRLGIASLPAGVTWRQLYGVSLLTGIGFTMSLFIAGLAFSSGPLLDDAKIGILVASLLSGLAGWLVLRGGRSEAEIPAEPGPRREHAASAAT